MTPASHSAEAAKARTEATEQQEAARAVGLFLRCCSPPAERQGMIKADDDANQEEHNVAEHAGQSEDRNTTNTRSLHNRFVVAAIDFHRTRVYPIVQGGDGRPEKVLDVNPEGHSREIAHKAGNPDGTYENGNSEYWREITDALRPAEEILLLGHGNGKANASHQWVAYVEKHDRDVAAKVVADVRADIDDLTPGDVLARARHYFGLDPARR